jgi:hypothetical protein
VSTKVQVQVVAAVVVLVFAIGIITSGGTVDSGWLKFYSYAVSVALVLLAVWNRWGWRTGLAQRFTATPRNLSGTWRGTLTSEWIDPKTRKSPPPKPAFLVLRQSASSLSVTMLTDEMRSTSDMARVGGPEGEVCLSYVYLSRPKSSVDKRSPIHQGTTMLDVVGRPATRLHGRYWTTRDSKGELDFDRRVARHADDYQSAEKLFL